MTDTLRYYHSGREHDLKLSTRWFPYVADGSKTFEIRKSDRDYKVGDVLVLHEYDSDKMEYMDSKPLRALITWLSDYEQQDGYVVLGIKLLKDTPAPSREKLVEGLTNRLALDKRAIMIGHEVIIIVDDAILIALAYIEEHYILTDKP